MLNSMEKNIDVKKKVLQSNLMMKIRKAKINDIIIHNYLYNGVYDSRIKNLDIEKSYYWELYYEYLELGRVHEFNQAVKMNNNFIDRRERLVDRISKMVNTKKALFITFTFTDDYLSKSTKEYRRELISRYLKKYGKDYVANIDFGLDENFTKREHYHAIVYTDYIDIDKWKANYGYLFYEYCKVNSNYKQMATYITKLTNHALKESTGSSRLLYCRNPKY